LASITTTKKNKKTLKINIKVRTCFMNVRIGITLHKQILKYKNNQAGFQNIVKLQGVIFVL
jgi:hypothetical protein